MLDVMFDQRNVSLVPWGFITLKAIALHTLPIAGLVSGTRFTYWLQSLA